MLTLPTHTIEPATDSALSSLRGIIYAIVNGYDGKTYIGKSSNTFRKRYTGGWWNSTKNILLQRVIAKHGHEQFKVYILEAGVPATKLNEREIYYAEILNVYCPNGYNLRDCGAGPNMYGEAKIKVERRSEKLRKVYHVTHIETNKTIEITYVKKWCEENNVREMAFRNLLCGLVETSQGYRLPETILTPTIYIDKKTKQPREYSVRRIATGEKINFNCVARFCSENGLKLNAFKTMISGRMFASQGYCLPNTILPRPTLFKVSSPNGKIYTTECLAKFNREHKTNLRADRKNGFHNGWSNLIVLRPAKKGRIFDNN